MELSERMIIVRKKLDLNQTDFANSLGLEQGSYSDIERGKVNKLSKSTIKLLQIIYNVNKDWIEKEEGEIFKTGPAFNENAKPLSDFNFMQIPFIPIYAQGGYPKGYGDVDYIESLPTIPVIVDKNYRGKYRVFEVAGDSMDDGSRSALFDGDKILCRDVRRELWSCKLHIKKYFFVIVHVTDGITVKQITDHNVETGEITCHPLNPIFDDFTLNLNEVVELYNVIKIVDRNTLI